MPLGEGIDFLGDRAVGVDYRGEAGGGGPNHAAAVLHRPEHRHAQVLNRAGGFGAPGIVGDVHQNFGPGIHEIPGEIAEGVLETDEGPGFGSVPLAQIEHGVFGSPGVEGGALAFDVVHQPGEGVGVGEVFGEGHQMDLAVGVGDAAGLEEEDGVVVPPAAGFHYRVVVADEEGHFFVGEPAAQGVDEVHPAAVAPVFEMPLNGGYEGGFRPDDRVGALLQGDVGFFDEGVQGGAPGIDPGEPGVHVVLDERGFPARGVLVIDPRSRAVDVGEQHCGRPG